MNGIQGELLGPTYLQSASRGAWLTSTCVWCRRAAPSQAASYGDGGVVVGPTSTASIKLHDFWSSNQWQETCLPGPVPVGKPLSRNRQCEKTNAGEKNMEHLSSTQRESGQA
jgi:hypothetical protein